MRWFAQLYAVVCRDPLGFVRLYARYELPGSIEQFK